MLNNNLKDLRALLNSKLKERGLIDEDIKALKSKIQNIEISESNQIDMFN